MEFVIKNRHQFFDWRSMSSNPGIRIQDFRENRFQPWVIDRICINTFCKDRKDFLVDKLRQFLAARKIQRWWLNIKYDPRTRLGRRYANQLYEENFD